MCLYGRIHVSNLCMYVCICMFPCPVVGIVFVSVSVYIFLFFSLAFVLLATLSLHCELLLVCRIQCFVWRGGHFLPSLPYTLTLLSSLSLSLLPSILLFSHTFSSLPFPSPFLPVRIPDRPPSPAIKGHWAASGSHKSGYYTLMNTLVSFSTFVPKPE